MNGASNPSTWRVSIRSSYERTNAPPGYLIAHVELVPGVLFAESERNPYTYGRWRYISFLWGEADGPTRGNCMATICVDDILPGSIAHHVLAVLEEVSAWFDLTQPDGARFR